MSKKGKQQQSAATGNIDIASQLFQNSKLVYNVQQEVITITKDKLELCLMKNQKIIEKKHEWVAPLGLFVSLLTTLLVSEFNRDWLLPKAVWNAVFLVGTVVSFIWLIISLVCLWRYRKRGTIDEIIGKIRAEQTQVESAPKTQ